MRATEADGEPGPGDDQLSRGPVLLTANQRLSRTLRAAHDEERLRAGQVAWESPAILPFGAWLRNSWLNATLTGAAPSLRLLNAAQSESIWRRIIAGSPQASSILDLRRTARSAVLAWELVQQYRLVLDGRCAAHEDWSAFRSWAEEYGRLCDSEGWLDEARLPDAARQSMAPEELVLAGFDEFTPQQQAVLDAMRSWRRLESTAVEGATVQQPCADAAEELDAAAEWAAELHRRKPKASIGVVLLSAGSTRAQLERAFGPAGDFHISMADPFAHFPIVSAALLALRLAGSTRWAAADVGRLLRSPYIEGGVRQAAERGLLDAELRRYRRAYVSTTRVAQALSPIVERWTAGRERIEARRLPSGWTEVFEELLKSAGWPGERSLSSHEYQAHQSWRELLQTFASLDTAVEPMSYETAVARLSELAEDSEFQPQDRGAAIQIVGPLEAAGARFDHLRIIGADDSTWPAPAHPHPFLPLSLQRDHELPHSSPAREWEFAERTFARLRASAPDVVVSWPQRSGDVQLRPSPLLERIPRGQQVRSLAARPVQVAVEQWIDERGPALENPSPRGGTQVIRLQSSCPFRAFAEIRLNARSLEPAELGLTAADKGKAVHKALELFWEQVRDHATLIALSPEELEGTAVHAARVAVRGVTRDASGDFDRQFREMEVVRVARLVREWAAAEVGRSPFEVAASERERVIEIGGLLLNSRMDRVDRLPDGRQVILDYKTTAPSPNAWTGERPDEPQLPLYAVSNEAEVAAVAFAQVGAGEKRFKGSAARDGILPGVKGSDEFRQQVEEWRSVLGSLARGFAEGRAEADPKRAGTCDECRLMALCRIRETVVAEEE